MLRRVLLTALVISYVICVLLLSGLQKGDLDANTLEKLQRHNVNIYDMNNESIRQECLLKSFSDSGKETKAFEITELPNDTSIRQIYNEPFANSTVAETQKSEILAPENYFVDKSNLREINVEGIIQGELNRNDNVNGKPSDINVTILQENKDHQIKFIQKNPTLENVLNFWVTLKQNDMTSSTKETTTTHTSTRIEEKVDTTKSHTTDSVSEDYLRSKKMEYLSRMLAEYLESETVPTTTQAIKKSTNTDIFSPKIEEVLAKNGKLYPINMDIFGKNVREMSELAEFINILNKDQDSSKKFQRRSQKEINNDDINKLEQSKDIPNMSLMNFSPTINNKSEKKNQALQFLNNMLKVNNKFKLNEPFNTELPTRESIVNNEEQGGNQKQKQFENEYTDNAHKYSEAIKNTKLANDLIQVLSPDVIQEIAEKVKAIVMKDIIKEIPTTETTTASCVTTLPTVNPTTPVKETNESSVIKTLMALFKEFKEMKDATTTTTHAPLKLTLNDEKSKIRNVSFDHMYPSIMDALNVYGVKTPVANLKQMVMNPYNQNFVPIPVGQLLQPTLQGPPQNFHQTIQNQVRPITIQTNSAEVAPLAIQMPKPMKVMNQHIILTTLSPNERHKQEHIHSENTHIFNYENPIYADLTKKLRIAENVKKEYRESYKDTIEKLKERIKYSPAHNRDKAHELHRPLYHHVTDIVGTNSQDTFNKQSDSNHHKPFNRASDVNRRETINVPEISSQSPESSYRDIITREFLSRLVDSNHHDVISQLIESNPHNSRPNEKVDLNHQSLSHQSDAYERFEHERSHPRFKATKFHEKLERIENRPQNSYEFISKTTKQSCCEAVAAREQMPLSKLKQRPRFDDTHFKNFIKSQQKVTDMLERILAAKTKGRSQSSENRS